MRTDGSEGLCYADSIPFLSLALDADISPDENLFGKNATALQTDIAVSNDNKVTGTLKYVTGYTGFSGTAAEQEGNYLAVHASAAEGAEIKALLIGGAHGEVTLDDDGIIVVRITSNSQKLRLTATTDEGTQTIIYDLSGLTLQEG